MITPAPDGHDLQRFVQAQDQAYEGALAEIQRGRKASHWMWFIFPQLDGFGASPMSQRYAIRSLAEARAYMAHAVLGPRLRACTQAAAELRGRSARAVFGSPDDLKLRSSLTLFEAASQEAVFAAALDALCDGQRDEVTVGRLAPPPPPPRGPGP